MIQSLAVFTWPDRTVPTPGAILEHETKPRLYVYICESCLDGVIVLDTHLERGPVLCRTCMEREEGDSNANIS